RVPVADMIEPLLDAAVHWLALGLPVKRLLIVEKDELKAAEVKGAFGVLKKRHAGAVVQATPEYRYDVFISYSRRDQTSAEFVMDELKRLWPGVRVFFDRLEIDTGAAWQQRIFEALDDCNKVIALYSPDYLASKVCQEEFNIAWMRHRDSDGGVLLPVYLRTAGLPTYMKAIQFIDCRESDRERLTAACRHIVAALKA
ncbi:MAG: toll/interleukin-1 receptor domain-containing protein, partial [Anaerolineae bacterium]|nr:toll/interleukin-1 receptor domain-containing protein [Anaerolineae bacterium]